MHMQRVFASFMTLALAVIGCGHEPEIVDGSSDAIVAGVVVRASGAPVTSALLSMLVVDSGRGDTMINEPSGVTDATGHFRTQLGVFLEPSFTGRVQITISPPAGEQLADTVVDVGYLRFGLQPPATSNTTVVYP
jgi:hypothetical protein